MNATMSVEHVEAFRVIGKSHDAACYAIKYVSELKEFIQKYEYKRKEEREAASAKAQHAAAKKLCSMSYMLNKGH